MSVALKFRAFAVALQLKADTLEPRELEKLRALAQAPGTDPLEARAIAGFCAQVVDAAADRARLVRLADDLLAWIEAVNMPEPPGADRRDLNG